MQCPKCRYEPTMAEMQSTPDECPKCGVYYAKFRQAHESANAEPKQSGGVIGSAWQGAKVSVEEGRRRRAGREAELAKRQLAGYANGVVVVDIKMSFWSMVVFMVKWVLAAIPAMLILALIFGLASSVFVAIPAYFDYRDRATASQSAANPAVMPSRAEPIPVNSDPGSQHEMVDIERAGTNVVITTRRVGKLGEVSYSKRFIDCLNARWKYLGEGSSIAAMNANERASGTFGFAHFESESIAHYIGRRACRGIAQTNHYLQ